jgi:hypothetical protein
MRLCEKGLLLVATIALMMSAFGATTPALAECTGYVCRSVCSTSGTCTPPDCHLDSGGGQCECEIKSRIRNGVAIVICRTSGGECSMGCGSEGPPQQLQSVQGEKAAAFRLTPSREMQAALASYSEVLLILESLRGRDGIAAGEAEMTILLSHGLPEVAQSFEPPRTAAVWVQATDALLLFEMQFEEEGLIASGELRRGGDTGVLEIHGAGEVLVERLSW